MTKKIKLLKIALPNSDDYNRPPTLLDVPFGDTIIGRGPFLQCTDISVSRSHALLSAKEDGKITLTTKNKKPCSYQRSSDVDKMMLLQDESVQLSNGDTFFMSPSGYGYKIQISDVEDTETCTTAPSSSMTGIPSMTTAETPKNFTNTPIKRVFPLWMDEDEELPNKKQTTTPQKKTTKEAVNSKAKPNKNIDMGDVANYEMSDDSGSDTQQKSSENIGMADGVTLEEKDVAEDILPADAENNAKSNDTFSEPNEELAETATTTVMTNQPTDDTQSTNTATSSIVLQRPTCQFREKCYRKNPQHKADYSHPGDADYVTVSTIKPRCPYGTSCYRVNPQHKNDFDHTQAPVTPPASPPSSPSQDDPRKVKRRTTKDKKKGYVEWDSGSEDSYDGSFIDDGSSDDYRPDDDTESDDDDDMVVV